MSRPAMQATARDSGSSVETVGARSNEQDARSPGKTDIPSSSTPSDDVSTTAYFHSAASTGAGSGSHQSREQQQQQHPIQPGETSALEAHIQRMEVSHSQQAPAPSDSPVHSAHLAGSSKPSPSQEARPQQQDAIDGVVSTDYAADDVFEGNAQDALYSSNRPMSGEGSSSPHFSVAAQAPTSTAPAQQSASSKMFPPTHTKTRQEHAPSTSQRRASNPFIFEDMGKTSSPAKSGQRSSPSQAQPAGPTQRNYTSSGPSRSIHHNQYASQQPEASTSTSSPSQQSNPKPQSRARRNLPTPNIDAAKEDYFSRHPDPDYGLRHGKKSSKNTERRPQSSSSHTHSLSDKASFSDGDEIASHPGGSRDHGDHQGSMPDGLLSPALSIGTLSSGVSVGPSMGGYERIFPIRSVVAGQKPLPQPTPGAASTSSSSKYPQKSKHSSYQSNASMSNKQHAVSASAQSVHSVSSGATAHQQRKQSLQHHDTLSEELEVGTGYSRRSPIPDDVSDFSFNSGRSAKGQGMTAPPRPHPDVEDEYLQRGDPASLYGTAALAAPSQERQTDSIFQPSAKPYYHRNDSLISQTTRSSDPAAVSITSANASSYPTTSRYSDDSDPTARKGTSTAPSTAAPTPGAGSSTVSRPPGLSRIPSQELGVQEPHLLSKGVKFDDNDPTQLAREAFEKGEAEDGPSVDSGGLGSLGTEQDGLFMTYRFEHQQTDDGHMIVTGRKGELLKCEDEPIHIPGAIQDYGVLIAVTEDEQGQFTVTHVSENSGARLGLPPKMLFSLNCFTELLDEDQADAFLEAMEALDENEESEPSEAASSAPPHDTLAGMNTFQLSGQGIPGSGMDGDGSRLEWTCWCAIHRPDRKRFPKLAIIELEHENDLMNPVMHERSEEEIEEDRMKEQSRSLFHGSDEEEGRRREEELRKHQNTGLDPADLPHTDDDGDNITASAQNDPPGSLHGVGRADGEVPDVTTQESSRTGEIGKGGGSLNDERVKAFKPAQEPPSPEGLGGTASREEIDASTISRIKPIRALRRIRKQKGGGDIMKLFSVLGQINDELNKSQDLQASLEIAAGVVAEITGFHRVMIYQFDAAWNGQVVAELVDYKQTRDLYRGLHFPASDIPAQARELYKINKVRLLYDRDQPTARLVCRSRKELETPLNLTHSQLRAMSPIHVKYLANMGVRASMSISIIAFGQLWGLISCHTYGRYGQRVAFPGRQLCRIIGDSISRNIERLSYAQRLQSRKLINTIPTNSNPGGYIIAKAEDLLSLFDADFGVLSIGDEAKILGSLDNSQEVLAILEYLRLKRFDQVQASGNILADFPDLDYPAGFQQVAGMLMVPLSGAGQDFIAFFRRGQLEHVHWAGNPYEKVMRSNQGMKRSLEPRKSFKIWSETVVGKSRGWSDENLETASVLRLVYGKFIEVWRQREAAVTSSRLTSLLLSNASHEVRTPLNHIINYLEMALEGPLDDDTRESLVRSHTASRALVHVINDLLDLTRTEQNQNSFLQDPLDLSDIIDEAVAIHKLEAQRRGVEFEVIENPSGTPQTLLGDRGKIRQIIANVTANAVKHTKEGKVTLEWGEMSKDSDEPAEASQDTIKIGISITDTGAGIPEDHLEEMFRTFEEVDTDAGDQRALKPGNLGLGLAVVARIVSQLGGQLRVESKVGHGSKFTFVLHFRLPGAHGAPGSSHSATGSVAQEASLRNADSVNRSIQRSGSTGSLNGSLQSNKLSNDSKRSEIESLVDVIGSNYMSGPVNRNQQGKVATRTRVRQPGQVEIEDSGTPLRSVKVDEGDVDVPAVRGETQARPTMQRQKTDNQGANTSFSKTGDMGSTSRPTPMQRTTTSRSASQAVSAEAVKLGKSTSGAGVNARDDVHPLKVLIVEDDAINRAILLKKLTKEYDHKVSSTVHGEEAVRLFEKDRTFDMILMDLQMPICDGFTATKRIREIEAKAPLSRDHGEKTVHSAVPSQTPIFAVSASLHEHQYDHLLECGFSGFILKPINFARLNDLMRGVYDYPTLEANQYIPGRWEKGGWLISPSPSPGS